VIQYIFGYLNDMSFLTINTMISMPVPGVAQILLQVLLNFVYLDLLMTDQWLPQMFGEPDSEDKALNQFF
jgi:hypothetical protein